MRILLIFLLGLLVTFNYQIWISDKQSVRQFRQLTVAVQEQRTKNAELRERNQILEAEVNSLKQELEAIEERARVELGMIRQDETFFRILEEPLPKLP